MPLKKKTTKKKTAKSTTKKPKRSAKYSKTRKAKDYKPVNTDWVKTFLYYYKKRYSIASAAKMAGTSRTTVFRLKKHDHNFAKKMEEAHEIVVDKLENSAMRRAIHGHNVPVYFQGVKCGTKRVYDNSLTIFMLKKNRPDKYDDKVANMIDPEEYAQRLNDALNSAANTVPSSPEEQIKKEEEE